MVEVEWRSKSPHLVVRMEGRVTLTGISPQLEAFEHQLGRMPAAFVLLVDFSQLESFDRDVAAVFVYLMRRVLDLEPAACVYVTGGRVVDPWMRDKLRQLDRDGVMHFFDARGEAEAFIRQLMATR